MAYNLQIVLVRTPFKICMAMIGFNYPDIHWETLYPGSENDSSEESKFIDCIQDNLLTQHIDRPTRVRGTDTPHILDLILTNDEKLISSIEYESPLGKSDHAVLQFDLLCYSKLETYEKVKYEEDKME